MMKPKRKKLVKAQLENELSKLERRIQTIANHAYTIRQAIEAITRQEISKNQKQGEFNSVELSNISKTLSAKTSGETSSGAQDMVPAAQETT